MMWRCISTSAFYRSQNSECLTANELALSEREVLRNDHPRHFDESPQNIPSHPKSRSSQHEAPKGGQSRLGQNLIGSLRMLAEICFLRDYALIASSISLFQCTRDKRRSESFLEHGSTKQQPHRERTKFPTNSLLASITDLIRFTKVFVISYHLRSQTKQAFFRFHITCATKK